MHNDNKKWKLRHKFSFSFRLSKCTKLNTTKRDLNTSWKYQICFDFVVKCKNLKYFGTTKNNNNDKIRFKVLIKSNLYRNKQFEHLQHTRKDYNTIQCIHQSKTKHILFAHVKSKMFYTKMVKKNQKCALIKFLKFIKYLIKLNKTLINILN